MRIATECYSQTEKTFYSNMTIILDVLARDIFDASVASVRMGNDE